MRVSASFYDGRDVLEGSRARSGDSTFQGASVGAVLYAWGNAVAGANVAKVLLLEFMVKF